MYFQLAKNSKLRMTASTADAIFANVVYDSAINPSSDFIDVEFTTFAIAYVGALNVQSISLKNTSGSNVSSICIYVDDNLLLPCFALAANQTVLIDNSGMNFQFVSPSVDVNVTCTGGGGGGGGGFSNVVLELGDIPFTALPGKCYIIEDGILPSDSTFDVSGLSAEDDEILILNRDKSYVLSYTGQTVYYADERVADNVFWQSNVWLRFAGGKLRVIQG